MTAGHSRTSLRNHKTTMGLRLHYDKKGMARARADVDLIMTAYNLRRLINIIGLKTPMEWVLQQLSYFPELRVPSKLKLARIRTSILFQNKSIFSFYVSLKPLYLKLNSAV